MKIDLLRKVDKYLGPIICRMFLFLKKVSGRFFSTKQLNPEINLKKALIIKFFGMGTILLSSPAIGELKKKFPQSEIIFLTLAQNKEVCETLPSIDKVLLLRIDGLLNFLRDFIGIVFMVRASKVDIVIDLEFLTNFSALTTLLFTVFNDNIRSIGFNSPMKWRNSAYTLNVAFDHSRHISKIFGKVMASICGEISNINFDAEKKALLKTAETGFLNDILCQRNSEENLSRLVCVNINSGPLSFLRRWPEKYFSILVDELVRKPNTKIVLIGGSGDIDYVQNFYDKQESKEQVINLCGQLSFHKLSGLFTKTDLLISNDSGPLHLATILGLPTISFFGPETPFLYGPVGEGHHVFYKDIFCSPCLNIYNSKISSCQDNICLKNITPETVLKVIEDKKILG